MSRAEQKAHDVAVQENTIKAEYIKK